MDKINQESNPSLSSQIEVNCQDKFYIAYLKAIEGRVEISFINQEESQFKWQRSQYVDELFNIHKSFCLLENLQEVFEYFERLIKDQIKNISFRENNMVIEFEIELVELVQCEYSTKEVKAHLNEQILNLKRQLKSQLNLEQIIQDQSKEIQQIKSQLAFLENYVQRQQMKQQEQEALETVSKIIKPKEFKIIKAWISDKEVDLNLIYRATRDGFEIGRIYEKCKYKKRVILVIKTTLDKRFGFYSDLEIKNYGNNYQAQNPNKIFIFSLNQKQKYASNDSNCQLAFYSNLNCLLLGDSDICLLSNSNSNNNSYVHSSSYGRNQGLLGNSLNGGNKQFQTAEVEIFEIIDI